MAARKNGTVVVEHEAEVTHEAEKVVNDLQAQGQARFNEIAVAVAAQVSVMDTARGEIVSLIRPIRDENLWAFGRNANGEGFANWKDATKYILNGAFSHWSKSARTGIVLMLIDEGFTTAEAAEVGEVTEGEAKKAVTEADNEAQGVEPVESTPPVELTPEQKADKVADQLLATVKKAKDAIYDMSADKRHIVTIELTTLLGQLDGVEKAKVAESAGTSAA